MPEYFKAKKAFTIIELLLVVVIVLIATAITKQTFFKNTAISTNDSRRIGDIDKIKVAIVDFYEKNNKYPPLDVLYSSQTTFKSDTNPLGASDWIPELVPAYIQSLPKDPIQIPTNSINLYLYYVSLDRKSYSIWARLENQKDPRIYNQPTAKCTASPPDPNYNYCGTF